jgi:hypothetical protein
LRSILATSRATFPCPTILTSSTFSKSTGKSAKAGWPLYQLTNANAGKTLPNGFEDEDEPGTDERGLEREAP